MLDHPLFRLFFDLTANGGWNLCAMFTWAFIMLYVAGTVLNYFLNVKGN